MAVASLVAIEPAWEGSKLTTVENLAQLLFRRVFEAVRMVVDQYGAFVALVQTESLTTGERFVGARGRTRRRHVLVGV
jgi:hypothetical protein